MIWERDTLLICIDYAGTPWRTLYLKQRGFAGSSPWSKRNKKGPGLVWATVKLTGATRATGCHGGKGSPKVRLKKGNF